MYQSQELYPELTVVQDNWEVIRDDSLKLLDQGCYSEMPNNGFSVERQNNPQVWYYCPFGLEAEDQTPQTRVQTAYAQSLAPRTVEILAQVKGLKGAMFSLLKPGGQIKEHTHENSYVTATMGLQVDAKCTFRVCDETRSHENGEFLVFDYCLPHEAWNTGDRDRMVLLLVLQNKLAL